MNVSEDNCPCRDRGPAGERPDTDQAHSDDLLDEPLSLSDALLDAVTCVILAVSVAGLASIVGFAIIASDPGNTLGLWFGRVFLLVSLALIAAGAAFIGSLVGGIFRARRQRRALIAVVCSAVACWLAAGVLPWSGAWFAPGFDVTWNRVSSVADESPREAARSPGEVVNIFAQDEDRAVIRVGDGQKTSWYTECRANGTAGWRAYMTPATGHVVEKARHAQDDERCSEMIAEGPDLSDYLISGDTWRVGTSRAGTAGRYTVVYKLGSGLNEMVDAASQATITAAAQTDEVRGVLDSTGWLGFLDPTTGDLAGALPSVEGRVTVTCWESGAYLVDDDLSGAYARLPQFDQAVCAAQAADEGMTISYYVESDGDGL